MRTTVTVRRWVTRLAFALALTPAAGRAAPAQAGREPATITGRVTSEAGAPVEAAAVTVRRLRLSARTDAAGLYRLEVPAGRVVAGAETLSVMRIGFRPAAVPFALAPGRVVVDVRMSPVAVALDEVVVTGTAGNQERRAQPAVVATINAAEIAAKAPVLNINELLYARTPGVSSTGASGTSGANTRIDIRGQASISLSNYPLVFVDGVRVTAGPRSVAQVPGGSTSGAGGQQLSALNDLNPDDIESVEIVKGPAAATLYGADASAGVIQILTKKGRPGARRLNQHIALQYDDSDPNFEPFTNYGKCTAALVAATSTNPLCKGQQVGTVVKDNALERYDVFDHGRATTVQYSAQGGGDSYGYYGSFSAQNERGTTLDSYLKHRTGRVNFNWTANSRVSVDATVGISRANDRLPQGDQSSFGPIINAGLGSPLSVIANPDGTLRGGFLGANLTIPAINAVRTLDVTTRTTPSVQMRYTPLPWLNNRLTVGADFVRTSATQMYPRNSQNWYSTTLNTGSVARNEINVNVYTLDYLGTITRRFGRNGGISSDLSFGSQWINTVSEVLSASGTGLLVNSNNVVGAATTITASQGFGQSKSLGLIAQEQLGFGERLYLQVGARVDRNSAFGSEVGTFFLPKAGLSYVLSQEPLWQRTMPAFISTFRLRGAYGTTGRSPSSTAALRTFSRANYVTDAGVVQPGVAPGSPGNSNLKPERGIEIEGGLDAGFFNDRLGLELTYFAKTSKDLLLPQLLAPSSGFTSAPLLNIGEVTNKGLEVSLRGTPLNRRLVTWDAAVNVNTLANKIVSMGSVTPFINGSNQCFKPGVSVAAWCFRRVLSADTVANRATVTDTAVVVGRQLPKLAGNINSTFTLFRVLRLYAQLDGKYGYEVYNLTRDLRDRSQLSGEVNLPAGQGGYGAVERLRRLGPFVTQTSGASVGQSLVRSEYIVAGDFTRLRELSLTWTLPEAFTRRLGVTGSSLSVGGKNLALWTKYDGWDPEVIGVVDPITPFLGDVFTTPQVRRLYTRLNLQF